ncbi:bile acid:sodium symporter family protein [Nocardioides marmoriginsengisoli]|uniref:Bile acid:sodium symporter family protein n=1 Tax=Nocardioides marmoriginsengisoli TaxID=661483 RepID=A0A3N0CAQ3_9ACTN|nr:bile acid:sodium symporter family protein [Nocardioides marmoriginsengisoli]RNL60389.1 bile acid:sodium symporter family protein [Nocardioides marmoriginsengisoli]
MDSALTSVALPAALAIIMFGLGLALTVDDFRRVAQHPKAVVIALIAQVLLLPALCFGLIKAFDLEAVLAVGMMLLAASPGGTTANLFSHLFRGDVALNISLTAINSVLAVLTLPVVVNVAINHFEPSGAGDVGLQFGKMLQVFAIVLVPVGIGMLVRRLRPAFSDRAERPVRTASAVVLVLVIAGALLGERENLGDYLADVGMIAVVFCACSLTIGYLLPWIAGVTREQAIATSFEVGIHNSTLAIAVAVSVLDNDTFAIPAAVYGIAMFPLAAAAGFLISRRAAPQPAG